MVVIRAGSAADAAQIAAVQREGWVAAYDGIISREVIDRVTAPDDGARVRQSYRTRPWQKIIVAEAGEQDAPRSPGAGGLRVPAGPGIVGYASFGPETNVLTEPWPHPLTEAGRDGQIAELYALYVHPAWWSAGTGRALMERTLARTATAAYQVIVLWVLRDNTRARRFYERAGFAPDGATNLLERLGGVQEVRYRRTLGRQRLHPGVTFRRASRSWRPPDRTAPRSRDRPAASGQPAAAWFRPGTPRALPGTRASPRRHGRPCPVRRRCR